MTDSNSGVITATKSHADADDAGRDDWISRKLGKAAETDQLPDRNVGTSIGGGLQPPYDPYLLAGLMEANGTHAACVVKKARREAGFGFKLEPYGDLSEEEASDEERERAESFWFGRDTKWQLGPTGTSRSTPDEIFEKAAQDHYSIGWDAVEVMYRGADLDAVGLAYLPAKSVRKRKNPEDADDLLGHGYVQKRDGKVRYFAEAGARQTSDDDPTDSEIYVDKKTGDVFEGSGTDLPDGFEPANEILYYPNWHPNAINGYGVPNYIAEVQAILNDVEARRFNGQRLRNDLQIDYIVKVEGGQLTSETRQNMREWFQEMRESDEPELLYLEAEELAEKADFNGTGDGDISIDLVPAQHFNDEDESFSEYRDRNRRDIAQAHEVPLPALAEHDSTNANTRDALRQLDENVIGPQQSRREERIYRVIHQQILGVDDWKLSFKRGDIRDPEMEADILATKLRAAGNAYTVNEVREAVDLEPLDEQGDELFAVTSDPILAEELTQALEV